MLSPPLRSATATEAHIEGPITGHIEGTIEGKPLIAFGGCNYLGLAHHPEVLAAAADAAARYGLSTSASRTTSGNTAEHEALEADLAALVGSADAALTPDGYTANIAAAQAAAPHISIALLDERTHRSQGDAARAAGLTVMTYRHLDADHAAEVAKSAGAPVLVMTDGVFAADGAIAPLRELHVSLTPESMLLVDDCHGFMVLGENGAGTCNELGVDLDDRVIVTTTLAKGLGCAGGAVLAPDEFVRTLRQHAGAFVCTTPPSPALVGAARAALRISATDPARRARLHANSIALAGATGRSAPACPTPISAFVRGDARTMRDLRTELARAGLAVPLISYPGGPAPTYFRASVTSEHTAEHLDALRRVLGQDRIASPPHANANEGG